uniref:Uncharacterized protein n=1 Tax=Oryza brachyantha TaxID=4533 RepID=J3LRM1_ORYBR
MKVKVQSSRIVKPLYDGGEAPPAAAEWMPLSVFDTVTYDENIAVIYAFKPPNPPTAALEVGLARAMAVYREWAGRLGVGPDGRRSVLLNDAGARARMRPPAPRGYFGNLVLWAFPRCDAGDLVSRTVKHAAELIHRAVAGVDDAYLRSFVDFASSGAVESEGLVPTADTNQVVLCPNLEVDSWLGISFYDLDFGGGCPFYFMPSYLPMEGTLFLVPSFLGDGSIEAYVPLFENHLEAFKKICYNIA